MHAVRMTDDTASWCGLLAAVTSGELTGNAIRNTVASFSTRTLRWVCGNLGLNFPDCKADAVADIAESLQSRQLAAPVTFTFSLDNEHTSARLPQGVPAMPDRTLRRLNVSSLGAAVCFLTVLTVPR
jgi:hypothetical protein